MRVAFLSAFVLAVSAFGQAPPAWVEKSNRNAQLLIDINAKYSPEDATSDGVKGLDEQIFSLAGTRTSGKGPISGTRGGNSKAVSRRSRTLSSNRTSRS